jgi:hypothetical protein
MRKRLLITASSVLAIGAIVFLLKGRRAPDPIIDGKPLSHWLVAKYVEHTGDPAANYEAIKSAGTNALPFLLVQIQQYRPPARWESNLIVFSRAVLPAKAANVIERQLSRSEGLAVACGVAFEILGTNASPAIPGLVRVATQKDPAERAQLALFALSGIGKETIPVFSEYITNRNLPHRVEAIGDLGLVATPSDSAQLLPIMYSCLQDPDPDVRMAAAVSIQRITAYLPRNIATNTPAQ